MLSEKDQEGRYPLSGKEYDELRCLIVALNEVLKVSNLTERIKTIPHGWRDFRLLCWLIDHFEDMLLDTVPTKKLMALKAELRNSKVALRVGWSGIPTPGVAHIDEKAFIQLLNMLVGMECWSCDKTGRDIKKCPIRNAYMDCLHYEPSPVEKRTDGLCEMAGWTSVVEEE